MGLPVYFAGGCERVLLIDCRGESKPTHTLTLEIQPTLSRYWANNSTADGRVKSHVCNKAALTCKRRTHIG